MCAVILSIVQSPALCNDSLTATATREINEGVELASVSAVLDAIWTRTADAITVINVELEVSAERLFSMRAVVLSSKRATIEEVVAVNSSIRAERIETVLFVVSSALANVLVV
jgi:hypothetical protein